MRLPTFVQHQSIQVHPEKDFNLIIEDYFSLVYIYIYSTYSLTDTIRACILRRAVVETLQEFYSFLFLNPIIQQVLRQHRFEQCGLAQCGFSQCGFAQRNAAF